MASSRGMNMRDMKSRQMNVLGGPPRPGSRPRGRPRRDAPLPGPREETEGDEPELLDAVEEAVHEAQGDGHFAPSARRYQKDEDERDCPSEPPPGWGEPE